VAALPFRIVAKRRKDKARAAELQTFFEGIWTEAMGLEYEVAVNEAMLRWFLYGTAPTLEGCESTMGET
jgi:hypothetical protein